MSGIPRIGIGAGDSRSKGDKTTTPVPDEATRAQNVAAERLRVNKQAEIAQAQALVAPDMADVALRDASSGKVRKVRAGSTRDSILGSAMQLAALLGASMLAWLASRGE